MPTPSLNLKKYGNKLNQEIKVAKSAYYIDRFTKLQSDSRKVWREITFLTNNCKSNSPLTIMTSNGELTGSDLATTFNDFFINVADSICPSVTTSVPDTLSNLITP